MKSKPVISLLILAALGSLGYAGENAGGILDKLLGTEHAKPITRDEWKLALSIKDYLGVDLVGAQGERLGKVVDFTLKDESGKFDRLVIAVGGTLGLGEVLIAVPYDEIQHKPGTPNLVWKVAQSEFHALVNRARTEARAKGNTKVSPSTSGESADKGATRLKDRDATRAATATSGADPDVEKAKAALESDHVIGKEISKVSVEKKDGRLVIAGNVEDEEQRRRILSVVKNSTRCEIVDELKTN